MALKIVLDQTFFALYLNAAYAALTETLKGSSPEAIFTRVKQSSWPSLRASWRFWPAGHNLTLPPTFSSSRSLTDALAYLPSTVHMVTYSVVPMHLRVLWVDVIEVVWVAILSSCVSGSVSLEAGEAMQPVVRESKSRGLDRREAHDTSRSMGLPN